MFRGIGNKHLDLIVTAETAQAVITARGRLPDDKMFRVMGIDCCGEERLIIAADTREAVDRFIDDFIMPEAWRRTWTVSPKLMAGDAMMIGCENAEASVC